MSSCSDCFKKSTTIIANTQTVTPNNAVQLGIAVKPCDRIVLVNNYITMSDPGTYLVMFSASCSGTTDATTVTLQLENNGDPLQGINGSVNMPTTASIGDISFTAVINVKPSCVSLDNTARLNIVNTGASANLYNAVISVVRL